MTKDYKILPYQNHWIAVDEDAEVKEGWIVTRNNTLGKFEINDDTNLLFKNKGLIFATTDLVQAKELGLIYFEMMDEAEKLAEKESKYYDKKDRIFAKGFLIRGYKAHAATHPYSEGDIKPLQDLVNEGYDAYDSAHHLQIKRMLKIIEFFLQSVCPAKILRVEMEELHYPGVVSGGLIAEGEFGGKGLTYHEGGTYYEPQIALIDGVRHLKDYKII